MINHFVWIDAEMTGLNAQTDALLEVAVIITTPQLDIVAEGPSLVIHQDVPYWKKTASLWVRNAHTASGLWDAVQTSTIDIPDAEHQLLSFIQAHTSKNSACLAGNTIYQDRLFLQRDMPSLIDWLHYRVVDVSSFKEVVNAWYPQDSHRDMEKKKHHRALDDIRESIEELRWYRTHFFKP